jgi:hypothetical protein
MKFLMTVLIIGFVSLISCNQFSKNTSDGGKMLGEQFYTTKAIPVTQMVQQMNGVSKKDFTISGRVTEVCKSEWCWVNLDAGNGKEVNVDTKKTILFPHDIVGKEIIANGYAFMDTTSVEQLKSDAKDDGKSQAEIDKITTPEIDVSFIATGVKIK